MSLTKATIPITRELYHRLGRSPKSTEREQMRSYCHLTEIYIADKLVAVRTITASATTYMGVKS